MANWFDPLREDLQLRLKNFEDLRDAEREKRLVEELMLIDDYLGQNQIPTAREILKKIRRGFPLRPSRNLDFFFREKSLLVDLAEIESKFLANSGNRRVLDSIRIQLSEYEQQSQQYSLSSVTTRIVALRRRVDEANVGMGTVPDSTYFTPLNIATFFVILLLALLTAIPLFTRLFDSSNTDSIRWTEITSWWYSLHPELLGALITFVLLNIIFDGGRRTQERKQRQYSFYLKLLYAETAGHKQEIIDEMRRERLLEGADLRGVDWDGVNLCNANLRRANLRNAQNIDKALFDTATILPNGKRFNTRDPIIENLRLFI